MIRVDGLSFRYPGSSSDALCDLSLTVREGSLFGLLGPNGSGKTTLVSLLSGVLPATAGTVRIDGKELSAHVREIQAVSALVPQECAFYPRLTVAENLRFFAGVQSIPGPEVAGRVAQALEITSLSEARSTRAEHCSGGMKRRLNFAIAMLNRPRLLFLDEPTVGIDPQSRHFILEAVRRLNRQGTTVVYTTHYMEEVEALCDEIGIVDGGRLLVQGSLAELLASDAGGHLRVSVTDELDAGLRAALMEFPDLIIGEGQLEIARCPAAGFHRLMGVLASRGVAVSRVKYGHGDLEELFLHLTKRQLRD